METLTERVQEQWRPIETRAHALRCTSQLLVLIDGTLDPYFTKVMPMVKAALLETGMQATACDMLSKILERLSVASLSVNLGTIVVSLLPCLQTKYAARDRSSAAPQQFEETAPMQQQQQQHQHRPQR